MQHFASVVLSGGGCNEDTERFLFFGFLVVFQMVRARQEARGVVRHLFLLPLRLPPPPPFFVCVCATKQCRLDVFSRWRSRSRLCVGYFSQCLNLLMFTKHP